MPSTTTSSTLDVLESTLNPCIMPSLSSSASSASPAKDEESGNNINSPAVAVYTYETFDQQPLPPFPPPVNVSGTEIRAKEVVLICLALMLLVCSILLFFKHWKKNYRDINQLPYYAYLYQKEAAEFVAMQKAAAAAAAGGGVLPLAPGAVGAPPVVPPVPPSQTEHWKFLAPWVASCFLSVDVSLKRFPQNAQANGDSLVWDR